MNKARIEELAATLGDVLKRQEEVKEEKKCHKVLWVFAIIGAVAAIAYAVYRYFTPDYLEDFEDDFDDDFDDDFFADDEDEKEAASDKKDDKAASDED